MNCKNVRPRAHRVEAVNYTPVRAASRAAPQLRHPVQPGAGLNFAFGDWLTLGVLDAERCTGNDTDNTRKGRLP